MAVLLDALQIVGATVLRSTVHRAPVRIVRTPQESGHPANTSGLVLERTLAASPFDVHVSVVVEGSAVPLTVRLLDPSGHVMALGRASIDGLTMSGLDQPVAVAGTYTVQIINTSSAVTKLELSVARTVRVR